MNEWRPLYRELYNEEPTKSEARALDLLWPQVAPNARDPLFIVMMSFGRIFRQQGEELAHRLTNYNKLLLDTDKTISTITEAQSMHVAMLAANATVVRETSESLHGTVDDFRESVRETYDEVAKARRSRAWLSESTSEDKYVRFDLKLGLVLITLAAVTICGAILWTVLNQPVLPASVSAEDVRLVSQMSETMDFRALAECQLPLLEKAEGWCSIGENRWQVTDERVDAAAPPWVEGDVKVARRSNPFG